MSAGHSGGNDGMEGELMAGGQSFAMTQASAEVDTQVATAKRYPRSIKQFKSDALSLATLDLETASSCFYTLPARKGGDGKPIEGPSIRMAEIVASAWGNIRVQASVVSDDGEFITVQGRCWDLEKNVAMSAEVRRRIVDKYGKRYSHDMISTTTNAACSIAIRNAVFLVVPRALFSSVLAAARKVAIGDATTLVKRRADMLAAFAKMGVSGDQVCLAVEKPSIEDITVDDLATLVGIFTAIRDGDTSVDEAFPKPNGKKADGEPQTATDKLAESLKAETPAADKEPAAAAAEPVKPAGPNAMAETQKAIAEKIANAIKVASEDAILDKLGNEVSLLTELDSAARDSLYNAIHDRRAALEKLRGVAPAKDKGKQLPGT